MERGVIEIACNSECSGCDYDAGEIGGILNDCDKIIKQQDDILTQLTIIREILKRITQTMEMDAEYQEIYCPTPETDE